MSRVVALVLFIVLVAGGVLAVPAARSASPDVVVSQVFQQTPNDASHNIAAFGDGQAEEIAALALGRVGHRHIRLVSFEYLPRLSGTLAR